MFVMLILYVLGSSENGNNSSDTDCNCFFICLGSHNVNNNSNDDCTCDCLDNMGTIYKFTTIDCGIIGHSKTNNDKAKPIILLGVLGCLICLIAGVIVIANANKKN